MFNPVDFNLLESGHYPVTCFRCWNPIGCSNNRTLWI
jgi:hypothetical protein